MNLPSKDKPYESWRTVRDDETIRSSVLKVLNDLLNDSVETAIPPEDGTNFEMQLKGWISEKSIDSIAYKFD